MDLLTDLDELFVYFDDKISNACAKLALLDAYMEKSDEECIEINVVLGNIQCMLYEINKLLKDGETDFENQTKQYDKLFQQLQEHVDYIENNLPPPVHQQIERNLTYTNVNLKNLKNTKSYLQKKQEASQTPKRAPSAVPAIKTIPKEKEVKKVPEKKEIISNGFPSMKPVDESEFDSIPKYMLGRLSIETLNESVDAFNATINAKYSFIKNFDVQTTKDADYKRHKQYKAQENAETKGVMFVTITDIKELSSMKNDATLRKAITCLRHCKRIKEIRGNPPKLIRYGLIQ